MGGSITAFVGGNGEGKTLGAVALHAVPSLRKGRPVAATFHIKHDNASLISDPAQLRELHNCTAILDEISAQYPSRGAMSLPPEMLRLIHQLRKPDVDLVYTCVDWARADVALREATKVVVLAKAYVNDKWQRSKNRPPWWRPFPARLIGPNGKPLRRDSEWDTKTLFKYTAYDANAFDQFTLHAIKNLRPLWQKWYWRPWHDDQHIYDTLEEVQLWRNVDDHGACLTCGGMKTRPKCTCPRTPPTPALLASSSLAGGGEATSS